MERHRELMFDYIVKRPLTKYTIKLWNIITEASLLRALVSHSFGFVYMRELGYYVLFWTSGNEANHCEATKDN